MKKFLAMAAIAALAVSMLAGPASAHDDGADVGTFNGEAFVGENNVECKEDGTDTISGQGLGLPVVDGVRSGHYQLTTVVNMLGHGLADLKICGDLEPVNSIGAACGMSQSTTGQGQSVLQSNGDVIALSNVTWAATVGGTLPTTGDFASADHGSGTLVSIVQAQGGAGCVDAAGAQKFTVVGVTALISE